MGKKNNNYNYDNFIKYIDILQLLINGNVHLNQFSFISNDLKKCDNIKTKLKEPKLLKWRNNLTFQLLLLTRFYHKNENINLIIIELKLKGTYLKLFISSEERKTKNFKINYINGIK